MHGPAVVWAARKAPRAAAAGQGLPADEAFYKKQAYLQAEAGLQEDGCAVQLSDHDVVAAGCGWGGSPNLESRSTD